MRLSGSSNSMLPVARLTQILSVKKGGKCGYDLDPSFFIVMPRRMGFGVSRSSRMDPVFGASDTPAHVQRHHLDEPSRSLGNGCDVRLPPRGPWRVAVHPGVELWSPRERLRTTLLWTHGILFALGALAVYSGIHSVEAMERSTARGGGLLGPLAYVPLLFGIPLVVLAFLSLFVALLVLPRYQPGHVLPGDVSRELPALSGKIVVALMLLALLSVFVLSNGLRPFLPAVQRQESAEAVDTLPARTRTEIAALREIVSRSLPESKAFFRSAVMNGRLGVLMLADREATLALTAANIQTAFDCLDDLDRENEKIMAKINKQSGPRTRRTGRPRMRFSTISTIRTICYRPSGTFSASRRDWSPSLPIGRPAKAPRGRWPYPWSASSTCRQTSACWLLFSYVAHGDEEAATTALRALAHLGAEAEPVVGELKRLGEEYWKNPATAALSWSVNQTVEEIEKKLKTDASRALK